MITKRRIWELLQAAQPGDHLGRKLDVFLLGLIALNIIAVVVESVDWVGQHWSPALQAFEIFSVAVFTLEYVARIYSCVVDPRFSHPVAGRLRYMVHPLALIDLAAIVPFYLPFLGIDLRFARMFRLFRIFRVAKLGRYSTAWKLIGGVLRAQKQELVICFVIIVLLITMAASVMYFVENAAQPDKFSDIPSSMWWAVTTLTTVGYGDIYPITPLGRLLGSLIQLCGIAFFALPTAVIGAGLIEELRNRRQPALCPYCGGTLHHDGSRGNAHSPSETLQPRK